MGQRSKVLDLPAETRAELDMRLITGGFRGYEALEAWLGERGFTLGKSSIHRYGSRLEERVNALKVATDQAKALVEASPDQAGDMSEALMRLMQERLFSVLMEMEVDADKVDLAKIAKAFAPIIRSDIALKRHAAEWRAKAKAVVEELAQAQGMGEEQAQFWMRKFLGVPG